MSEKTVRTVRLVYGCVLSFLLILTGLCLILAALSIYYGGGESPYTPEAISTRFWAIAVPVFATLGAIAVGIVLHLFLPAPARRPRARSDARAKVRLAERKREADTPAYRETARKERELRVCLRACTAVLSLASAVPAILHLASPDSLRYPEYNASIIEALPTLLLFCTLLTALLTVCTCLCDKSYNRQLDAVKALPMREEALAAPTKKVTAWSLRLAILAVSLLLLVLGILGGGMEDVLAKAINICTECIGLG